MKREELLITLEVLEKFMSKSLTKKERDSLDNVHTMITFYEYELFHNSRGRTAYTKSVYGRSFLER